jgi:proteic killer suppression protein
MTDIRNVMLTTQARKDLRSVPRHVLNKLQAWIELVEMLGLREVRKVPGFHDEPLKGTRRGQRSIRLNRAYRAMYTIEYETEKRVRVQEVNKHRY